MQIGNIGRDQIALRVVPGSGPDAVARVDGWHIALLLLAQIGVPGAVAGTGGGSEILTNLIGAGEATEIARARDRAGDEEAHRHLRLLLLLLLLRLALRQHDAGAQYHHRR